MYYGSTVGFPASSSTLVLNRENVDANTKGRGIVRNNMKNARHGVAFHGLHSQRNERSLTGWLYLYERIKLIRITTNQVQL